MRLIFTFFWSFILSRGGTFCSFTILFGRWFGRRCSLRGVWWMPARSCLLSCFSHSMDSCWSWWPTGRSASGHGYRRRGCDRAYLSLPAWRFGSLGISYQSRNAAMFLMLLLTLSPQHSNPPIASANSDPKPHPTTSPKKTPSSSSSYSEYPATDSPPASSYYYS